MRRQQQLDERRNDRRTRYERRLVSGARSPLFTFPPLNTLIPSFALATFDQIMFAQFQRLAMSVFLGLLSNTR